MLTAEYGVEFGFHVLEEAVAAQSNELNKMSPSKIFRMPDAGTDSVQAIFLYLKGLYDLLSQLIGFRRLKGIHCFVGTRYEIAVILSGFKNDLFIEADRLDIFGIPISLLHRLSAS